MILRSHYQSQLFENLNLFKISDIHDTSNHRTKRSESIDVDDRNPENEEMFWNFGGQLTLQDRLSQQINTNVAKNTILFIGDGMSISTVAAARTYLGKCSKLHFSEHEL